MQTRDPFNNTNSVKKIPAINNQDLTTNEPRHFPIFLHVGTFYSLYVIIFRITCRAATNPSKKNTAKRGYKYQIKLQ